MADWVKKFLDTTKGLESPKVYFQWAALATIAAIAKRSVWMDRDGAYNLYPNIFVILVGKSGLKKGIPVSISQKLVEKVDNTRVIHGRGSVQGVVNQLAQMKQTQSGANLADSCGFFNSGEFASSLVEDPVALTILTDLYDCHFNDNWKTYLTSRLSDELKEVCLTLLSASNQVHLREAVPDNAIGGGFVARTFFVLATKRQNVNSLIYKTGRKIDIDELARWLFEVAQVKGEMIPDEPAQEFYHTWYNEFSEKNHDDDRTGTSERIGDHVLKVAMLLSLSRRLDLTIKKEDMQDSLKLCVALEPNLERAMIGQPSKAQLDYQAKVLLEELLITPDGIVSRTRVLRRRWGEVNALELDIVAENLQQAQLVRIFNDGNETFFEMTDYLKQKYGKAAQEEEEV